MYTPTHIYIYEEYDYLFQLYAIAMSRVSGYLLQSNVSCKSSCVLFVLFVVLEFLTLRRLD